MTLEQGSSLTNVQPPSELPAFISSVMPTQMPNPVALIQAPAELTLPSMSPISSASESKIASPWKTEKSSDGEPKIATSWQKETSISSGGASPTTLPVTNQPLPPAR